MSRNFGRRGLFFKSAAFAALIAFAGCSVKRFPDVSHNATELKSCQSRDNIALALDPLIEKDRLERFFGVDLLNEYAGDERSYAILPVYVAMENRGDHSVLLQTDDVHFLTADGTVIGSAVNAHTARIPAHLAYRNRQRTLNAFARVGIFIPPLLLGVMLAFPFALSADATDRSAEAGMISKALPEKSLGRGEANKGFVYFLFKDDEIPTLRNVSKIRVNVGNLDTGEKTAFDFEIGSGILGQRLGKHDRKPAEATHGH